MNTQNNQRKKKSRRRPRDLEVLSRIAQSYTISEFLELNPISRAYLYKLWAQGIGPRFVKHGRRVLIPREAAEAWLRDTPNHSVEGG